MIIMIMMIGFSPLLFLVFLLLYNDNLNRNQNTDINNIENINNDIDDNSNKDNSDIDNCNNSNNDRKK